MTESVVPQPLPQALPQPLGQPFPPAPAAAYDPHAPAASQPTVQTIPPVGSLGPIVPRATSSGGYQETITCPECGEIAAVETGRRRSEDFCWRCDFPLFWASSTVITPAGEETGASLRRLPGTVGRAATAALACPHCGEPNAPAAAICVRCGGDLHPVAPPPPPVPVMAPPPPPPEPEPEPEKPFPLWWVLIICLCTLAIAVAVVWVALS